MHYFAYGTNINPRVLARKGVAHTNRHRAVLHDHKLCFNKKSLRPLLPSQIGFANILGSAGDRVEGAVYEVAQEELTLLDRLERSPEHYERIVVSVAVASRHVEAITYRAHDAVTESGLLPSRNYINHILDASDCLSPSYREALERLDTYSEECAACHQKTVVLFHREGCLMYVLCAPCLEAKRTWSDTLGRCLTVLETEAVMMHLMSTEAAYDSVTALIQDIVALGLVERDHSQGRHE